MNSCTVNCLAFKCLQTNSKDAMIHHASVNISNTYYIIVRSKIEEGVPNKGNL